MSESSITVITDIQGNLPALEAALARIERFDYDAEYAAGQVAAAGLPGEYAEKLLVAA